MSDISLFFEQRGEGFPLILLHGNGESLDYFKAQFEPFSKHYRVIAVDTRGHGRSPRGTAPFTIRQFAEDLREFMAEQGITRANILGFSDGGNIALCFALKYPEMVNCLVLNGANLAPSGVRLGEQLPIEIGYRLTCIFSHFSVKAHARWELMGLMVNDPNIPVSELSHISAPTLVIVGDRDMIKQSHSQLIADSIPGAQLRVLAGDHFIAARCSEEYNEAVLGFLCENKY